MAKKEKTKVKKNSSSKNKRLSCAIIFIVLLVACICMCVLNTMTESYNIEVGDIADRTITAPYDVIDEYSTNIVKEEEMQKVAPVYTADNSETDLSKQQVSDAFSAVETARARAQQLYMDKEYSNSFEASSINWESVLNESDMKTLKDMGVVPNKKVRFIVGTDEDSFEDVVGEADTLAGLLLELKGEFPKRHEKLTYRNFTFEILEMDERRILKVKVTLSPLPGKDEETAHS